MTVNTTIPRSGPYTADGVNRLWAWNWKITEATHLTFLVTDADGSNPVEYSTGYEFPTPSQIGADSGGTARFPIAPVDPITAGKKVWLLRSVPYAQSTAIGNQGGFTPETHEKAFDKLGMQIQQLNEKLLRAVIAEPGTNPADLQADLFAAAADAAQAVTDAEAQVTLAQAAATAADASADSAASAAATAAADAAADVAAALAASVAAAQLAENNAETAETNAAASAAAAAASAASVDVEAITYATVAARLYQHGRLGGL
jgi:hypothetical protein